MICNYDIEQIIKEDVDCSCRLTVIIRILGIFRILSQGIEFRSILMDFGILQKILYFLSLDKYYHIIDKNNISIFHEIHYHCINILKNICYSNQIFSQMSISFNCLFYLFNIWNIHSSNFSRKLKRILFQTIRSLWFSCDIIDNSIQLFFIDNDKNLFFFKDDVLFDPKFCVFALESILYWLQIDFDNSYLFISKVDNLEKILKAVFLAKGELEEERALDCLFHIFLKLIDNDKQINLNNNNVDSLLSKTSSSTSTFVKLRCFEIIHILKLNVKLPQVSHRSILPYDIAKKIRKK